MKKSCCSFATAQTYDVSKTSYVYICWLFPLVLLLILQVNTAVSAQQDATGKLLISEVGYNTIGDDSLEEWFELVNIGDAPLLLDDIRVGDEETTGGGEGMLRFPDGVTVGAGETLLIAQTAVGFRNLFGFAPDFEIQASDTAVPDLPPSRLWATGDMALGNDGDELLLLQDNVIIDAVNYGDRTTFFAPSVATVLRGQSIARIPANCDTDTAADWETAVIPTPGSVTFSDECAAVIDPDTLEELPTIGEIQGVGDASPFVNQSVSFRGIMTGYHADTNASGITFYTIFVQEYADQSDGDPQTSDAMPVFLGRERPFTQIGDALRITGQVTEFFGLTEIDDNGVQILVESSGNTLPEPILLDSLTDFEGESLEGMRVTTGDLRVAGATIASCSLFVLPQDGGERPFIRGDEETVVTLPLPILHHDETDCAPFPNVKTGDQIAPITGPLTYHFDQFKILTEPERPLVVTPAALPTPPTFPAPQQGQISVATFNMLNHFDNIDDTGNSAEPKPSLEAINQKQQKLHYAIANLLNCPTIIGVQEVEKEQLLLDLAAATAPDCGFTYQVVHFESPDARGIDLALLAHPDVRLLSSELMQTCTAVSTEVIDPSIACPANETPLFSRPPLRVDALVGDEPFTFVVNHFKSKRGGEAETVARRQMQARVLNLWAEGMLSADPEVNLVVMGDFNDYEQSRTTRALTANGRFTNILLNVPDDARYSFVFSGAAQLIDGILLSPSLVESVADVQILHVNADFPASYELDTTPALLPFRSSDHDLPIVLIDLNEPEVATAVPTVGVVETAVVPTLTPTSAPTPPADNRPLRGWIAAVVLAVGLLTILVIRRNRGKR